jgi:hypothetical protein
MKSSFNNKVLPMEVADQKYFHPLNELILVY